MLKQVEIQNYRSCRRVILRDLGPLTVLVGRNAAGKTNVLRAIQWLAANATGSPTTRQSPVGPTHVSCDVVVGEKTYHYSRESEVTIARARKPSERVRVRIHESLRYTGKDGAENWVFEREGEVVTITQGTEEVTATIGETAPCMPALVSLLPADSPTTSLVLPLVRFLERIRYYPLESESGVDEISLVRQSDYDEWLARQPSDLGGSAIMRLLHMTLTNEAQLAEVRSLVGPDGLGLVSEIDHRQFQDASSSGRTEGTNSWHWFRFRPAFHSHHTPEFFDFGDLSAGTQRLVRIVASLVHDQSAVMLLEHPEDCIHRALLRKLIGLLKTYSDQTQLIIASHSPVVFNTLDPNTICLVTMEEDGTSVRPLTAEELRVAAKFLEEDGALSDFIETIDEG